MSAKPPGISSLYQPACSPKLYAEIRHTLHRSSQKLGNETTKAGAVKWSPASARPRARLGSCERKAYTGVLCGQRCYEECKSQALGKQNLGPKDSCKVMGQSLLALSLSPSPSLLAEPSLENFSKTKQRLKTGRNCQ